jgi:hypothetical protein
MGTWKGVSKGARHIVRYHVEQYIHVCVCVCMCVYVCVCVCVCVCVWHVLLQQFVFIPSLCCPLYLIEYHVCI